MKNIFKPKTELEKFGFRIYNALVENFGHTYFVGGTVRDLLLRKKTSDLDIATEATPQKIAETLKKYCINFNTDFQNMGVIIAGNKQFSASIASFRKDLQSKNRYPKIQFVKTAKEDAKRRDLTINALYLSPKNAKILDFYSGLKDLKNKKIKFIGKPATRIKEDPLRIIRALRFCLQLNFKLEKNSKIAVKQNLKLINTLTKNKISSEINKLQQETHKKIILSAIVNKKILDKYFK